MPGVSGNREMGPFPAAPTSQPQTKLAPHEGVPTGYEWDAVKGSYVPSVGSAATLSRNATRLQQQQDADRAAAADQSAYERSRQQAADARNAGVFSSLSSLMSAPANVGTPKYSAPPPVLQGLTAAAAPMPQLAPVDTSEAERAAFGRAKDTVGQESAGALTGLRSALAGRGMLGSQAELRGTGNIIQAGQQQLGETSRQQAMGEAEQAQKNAETNYAGGLTQRGQDIGREQGMNSLALEQRGQDINAQIAANNLAVQQAQAAQAQRTSVLQGLLASLRY